jgi:hypothetical protein
MIRFSALLVALAIGLLVAGVAASNLPLVYVSIAVCAVAALLLAAGVLRHWPEIFGSGARRTEPSPFAASRRVPSPATAGQAATRPAAASGRPSPGRAAPVGAPGLAGFRADAGAAPAARGPEPTVAADRYQATRRPAESGPDPAQAEPIHAAATDDLWDRVNEELESAGKRDSGRLSWPAQDFSIPSGMSLPAEPPGPETLAVPGGPGSDDLWQPAAGWQPPRTPQSNWPFAPPAEPASPRPASRDTERDADAEAAASERTAAEDAAPRWTIRPQAGEPAEPAQQDETVAAAGEAKTHRTAAPAEATEAAEATQVAEPVKPAAAVKGAEPAEPAEPPKATEPVKPAESAQATEPAGPAGPAESSSADEPDDTGQPGADTAKTDTGQPGADTAKTETGGAPDKRAKPAKPAGPVQVTVVPGVARYHRAECILIRFLGEDDLETMPKQQAVSDGLTACRACQPDELPDS